MFQTHGGKIDYLNRQVDPVTECNDKCQRNTNFPGILTTALIQQGKTGMLMHDATTILEHHHDEYDIQKVTHPIEMET